MAAGQTVIEYNDLEVTQCLTTRFEQAEELDPSGVDTMFHRYKINVVGYVHGKQTSTDKVGVTPNRSTGNAADTMEDVKKQLSEPRKKFKMHVGVTTSSTGQLLLEAEDAGQTSGLLTETCDVCNGPRCSVASITRIVGNDLYRVELSFDVCLPLCEESVPTQSRILSNKWNVIDSIDKDKYTTRTFSGRLRCSGGDINANSFRYVVVPSVMPGMRIQGMQFDATPDGLWLDYTIVHREVAYSAPDPATSWDVVHTERSSIYDPIGVGEVNVTLAGDRDVDRRELIALGLAVMNDRLRDGERLTSTNHYIQSLAISDFFGSEGVLRVNVNAVVRHVVTRPPRTEQQDEDEFIIFASRKIGTPIDRAFDDILSDYDSNITVKAGASLPTDGPVKLAGAFVAHLQSVCDQNHDTNCGYNITTLPQEESNNCDLSFNVVERESEEYPEEFPDYTSEEHQDAIYTSYQMESTYRTPSNAVAMPVARDYYSEGNSQEVIYLSQPSTVRVMRMQGERVGRSPRFPSPVKEYTEEDGTVGKLLQTIIKPKTPTRTPDGHQLIEIDAEYHYALTKPVTQTSSPRIGVNPWSEEILERVNPVAFDTYSEDSVDDSQGNQQ